MKVILLINLENGTGVDSNVFWMSTYSNFGGWLALFLWEIIRLKFVWVINYIRN